MDELECNASTLDCEYDTDAMSCEEKVHNCEDIKDETTCEDHTTLSCTWV